jgi:hypothetical protein
MSCRMFYSWLVKFAWKIIKLFFIYVSKPLQTIIVSSTDYLYIKDDDEESAIRRKC